MCRFHHFTETPLDWYSHSKSSSQTLGSYLSSSKEAKNQERESIKFFFFSRHADGRGRVTGVLEGKRLFI